jgi:hypothetical protein
MMKGTQASMRIVISNGTSWARLLQQVADRDGETYTVVGTGERARHLLARLHRAIPNVRLHHFNDRESMAVVGTGEGVVVPPRLAG